MFDKFRRVFLTFCIFALMLNVCYAEGNGVLIHEENLVYKGAFRLPQGQYGDSTRSNAFSYGGFALTYNPTNNSIILEGHLYDRMTAEISIPTIINSTNVNDLKTGTVLQPPKDLTSGTWDNLGIDGSAVQNGVRVGGFLLYGDKLIGSAYAYYDGLNKAALSHFTASANWATEEIQFSGFQRVGLNPDNIERSNGGFVGGYMALIPPEWQSAFGGQALTGLGAVPIISRTSYGPCASVFNPDDIGVIDPAPATMLVGYTSSHPTLGGYSDTPSLYFNRGTLIKGLVFPTGSDSVLFFGRHGLGTTGLGDSCYGLGTADPDLGGTAVPGFPDVTYCYDPADSSKGTHAYPYVYRIWAYDANDLAKVKSGTINTETGKPYEPWDIIPYGLWDLDLPFAQLDASILGAAFDPQTQKIYISQQYGERPNEPFPLIHVYQINLQARNLKYK